MLTSKQRARLRSQANGLETIMQVGKAGVSPMLISQIDAALTAREMIKLRVLDNAMMDAGEVAAELADKTHAEVVQVIGTRLVLFRRIKDNPIYQL